MPAGLDAAFHAILFMRGTLKRTRPGRLGMKVDLYTKAVLTVIAACLCWMCLNSVTPSVAAQAASPSPTPVVLVDLNGTPLKSVPVIVGNPSLPVELTNRPLAVAVESIQRGTAWDPIRVQVMREPPTLMPIP